jgi:hypothetical protein
MQFASTPSTPQKDRHQESAMAMDLELAQVLEKVSELAMVKVLERAMVSH